MKRVIALVLACLLALPAWAQTRTDSGLPPVATFEEIAWRVSVKSGATLIVTDSSGQRVRGKLTALSGDALSILSGDRTLTFRSQQVREVQQRLPDTRLDGGLLGFAIGWLVPAAVCSSGSDSSETAGCVLGAAVVGGLPGLGIGMIVDSRMAKTVTVFRSAATARLVVAPAITSRGLEARASVRW